MKQGRGREGGIILLTFLILGVVAAAMSAALILLSNAESRVLAENVDNKRSFYLAESGLDAAKWELAANEDPGYDGPGNVVMQGPTDVGSYSVTAEDLGGNLYRLISVSNAGDSTTTLEVVVGEVKTTSFPYGAISIIGAVDKYKLKIKKQTNLLIDGGDRPAIVLTDQELYEDTWNQFLKAIEKGHVAPENLLGTPENSFTGDFKKKKKKDFDPAKVSLPIQHETGFDPSLHNFEGLYDELVQHVSDTILPAALKTTAEGSGKDDKKVLGPTPVYGTPDAPTLVYLTDKHPHLRAGQTLTGFGTLVIGDDFKMDEGTKLDWHGNVVVMGHDGKKATVDVHGDFNVTGTVVVLGEGKGDAEFKVKKEGSATIDGGFFILSSSVDGKGKKAKLDIQGDFTVNGLATLFGGKVEWKSKKESDVLIDGMLQIGSDAVFDKKGKQKKSSLKIDFQGDVEIYKNDEMIVKGAESIGDLGADWDLAKIEAIVSDSFSTVGWRQVK